MKLLSVPRKKYSSARLRPPTTAVGDEQLVVHAVVEPLEIERHCEQPARSRSPIGDHRVEQPDLDVGGGGQAGEQVAQVAGVEIVDRQAYAHAALSCVAQRPRDRPAGRVVSDQVVLQVDRVVRVLDHREPCVECESALHQRPYARLARRDVRGSGGIDKWSFGCGHTRQRRHSHDLRQRCSAAGEQRHQRSAGNDAQAPGDGVAQVQRSCRSSVPKRIPSGSISSSLAPASTRPATMAGTPCARATSTVRAASAAATKIAKPAPMLNVL